MPLQYPSSRIIGQIDDLIGEINARSARNERVLVTTLTKKMAEDLTQYLQRAGIKVRYMHGLTAEEALLVRVQNGDQTDLRHIQALPQEVDAHQHVELPLKFDEFQERFHQAVFVSATPAEYERSQADQIVEQVIRPTGLLDPKVEVRPVTGQIDDLIGEINARSARNERLRVPGRPADGLDQAGLAAEEPLLVRVQDGHQADLERGGEDAGVRVCRYFTRPAHRAS